jgi:hypothetical protein
MSADTRQHASAGLRVASARGAASVAALGLLLTLGCYTYTPVSTRPEPGTRVALDLNDRGRVALGDSIGTSADRIEGILQPQSGDSAYVLRVKSVRYLNGETNNWTDEPLTVRSEHVRSATERRFSRRRTTIAVASSTAAFVAFVVSRNFFGIIGPNPDPGPDPEPGPQQ